MTPTSKPIDPAQLADMRKRHAQAYIVLYAQEWEKDNTLTPEKFHKANHEKHVAMIEKAKAVHAAKGGK